jgi:hypothetical protein
MDGASRVLERQDGTSLSTPAKRSVAQVASQGKNISLTNVSRSFSRRGGLIFMIAIVPFHSAHAVKHTQSSFSCRLFVETYAEASTKKT